jgi:hypothetical protein
VFTVVESGSSGVHLAGERFSGRSIHLTINVIVVVDGNWFQAGIGRKFQRAVL